MRKLFLMVPVLFGLQCASLHSVTDVASIPNYTTRVSFSPAAFRTLSRDFDTTDVWQKERGYCVKDYTVVKSGNIRHIEVRRISRAFMFFADQQTSAFLCGFWRFQSPSIHTHPPSNCYRRNRAAKLDCTFADFRRSNCIPSEADKEVAKTYPARFQIVQCWNNIFQVYAYKEQ